MWDAAWLYFCFSFLPSSYRFPSVLSVAVLCACLSFSLRRLSPPLAHCWRCTENRFQCKKFKKLKKKKKKEVLKEESPFSCRTWGLASHRHPIPRILQGPRQTHCPHCGQDAEGDARARPKKQAGGIRPIRRSFPCSVAFNESESEIAISSFGVTAVVPTPTCAPRERKRHRPRSLATRKREASRPMTFCGWRNRAKDFLRSRWLAARGESCVACGVTRGVALLLTRRGRAHVVLGGCILSPCQHHLSRERRRQPTRAEASARDQNLVRGKFSRRWDRYSAVEMCVPPPVA